VNKGRILLKLVMDEAGLQLILDRFSQRLILQKKFYLLQLTGLDLGYRYNWYLKGRYSPALTRDAFYLQEEIEAGEKDYEEYALTEASKTKAEQAKTIWETPKCPDIDDGDWLELLASLHYLKHIAYWPGKKKTEFDDVFARMVAAKPHFSDKSALAKMAWEQLKELGLIDKKTLS